MCSRDCKAFSRSDVFKACPLFRDGHASAKQARLVSEYRLEIIVMLFREDLSRSHEYSLSAGICGGIYEEHGDCRLSRADVALHQSAHGPVPRYVAGYFIYHTLLCVRQIKREAAFVILQDCSRIEIYALLLLTFFSVTLYHVEIRHKALKLKTHFCSHERLARYWEMYVSSCVFPSAERIPCPHTVGQSFLHLAAEALQGFFCNISQIRLRNARNGLVHGYYTLALFDAHGICH